mgnify:CR=1 FL=1
MITLQSGAQVFLAKDPVDMRKSIDGLSIWIVDTIGRNPQSGSVTFIL